MANQTPDSALDKADGHTCTPATKEEALRGLQMSMHLAVQSKSIDQLLETLSTDEGNFNRLCQLNSLDQYLDEVQFIAPIRCIDYAIRRYYREVLRQPLPPYFERNFLCRHDKNRPLMRWIGSSEDIIDNPNRTTYQGVDGTRYTGPDCMALTIQKQRRHRGERASEEPFTQYVAILTNHSEGGFWDAWSARHHPLLRETLKQRKLRKAFADGHADEMSDRNNLASETIPSSNTPGGNSLFALACDNDRRNGISSFNASGALSGVIDPRYLFKSGRRSWNSDQRDGYWVRMHPQFVGGQASETGLQLHSEPESRSGKYLVSDQDVASDASIDIAHCDIDYFYYMETPRTIAEALKRMEQTYQDVPSVALVISPDWMDEKLSMLYAQILVELLHPPSERGDHAFTERFTRILEQLYDRLQELGREYVQKEKLNVDRTGTLYEYFVEVSGTQRERDIHSMAALLLAPDEIPMNSTVNGDQIEWAHYYRTFSVEGRPATNGQRLRNMECTAQLELEEKLFHSFASSPFEEIRALDWRNSSPISQEEILARGRALQWNPRMRPGAPPSGYREAAVGDPLIASAMEDDEVDLAIGTIMDHLLHNFVHMTQEEVLDDLRMLVRIVGSNVEHNPISDKPRSLKHSILGFLHVFGLETGLFDYRFSNYLAEMSQLHNWRTRISMLHGPFADAHMQDAVQLSFADGAVDACDLATLLAIDGGGRCTVRVRNERTDQEEELCFSFARDDAHGQEVPEAYAEAIVNGYLLRDQQGHLVRMADGADGEPSQGGVPEHQSEQGASGILHRWILGLRSKLQRPHLFSSHAFASDEVQAAGELERRSVALRPGIDVWAIIDKNVESSARQGEIHATLKRTWHRRSEEEPSSPSDATSDRPFATECTELRRLNDLVVEAMARGRREASEEESEMLPQSKLYLRALHELQQFVFAIQRWDFRTAREKLNLLSEGRLLSSTPLVSAQPKIRGKAKPLGWVLRHPPALFDGDHPRAQIARFLESEWKYLETLTQRTEELYRNKDPNAVNAVQPLEPPATDQFANEALDTAVVPMVTFDASRRQFLVSIGVTAGMTYVGSRAYALLGGGSATPSPVREIARTRSPNQIPITDGVGYMMLTAEDAQRWKIGQREEQDLQVLFMESFQKACREFPRVYARVFAPPGTNERSQGIGEQEAQILSRMLTIYELALHRSRYPQALTREENIQSIGRQIFNENFRDSELPRDIDPGRAWHQFLELHGRMTELERYVRQVPDRARELDMRMHGRLRDGTFEQYLRSEGYLPMH